MDIIIEHITKATLDGMTGSLPVHAIKGFRLNQNTMDFSITLRAECCIISMDTQAAGTSLVIRCGRVRLSLQQADFTRLIYQ